MRSDRDPARIRISLLLLSAVSWGLLLIEPGGRPLFAHCVQDVTGMAPLSVSYSLPRAFSQSATLAAGWGWLLMLAAMMAPLLVAPMRHVHISSFAHRRVRSIVLFFAGYLGFWIIIGIAFLPVQFGARLLTPESYMPAVAIALIALVWQCSPCKQWCLNRCCSHRSLAAFGRAADWDAIRFGLQHGVSCAGSCWALMLFPMLLPNGHLVMMALISILLFCERLDGPMPPSWRLRGLGRASRIAIAQARMRLAAN